MKRPRLRRALGGLLLAVAVGGARAGAEGTVPARPLRVMTFNLLHGGAASGLTGDGQRLESRLAMTIEELRALAPDIVALQEASVSRQRGNVAARLAATLGFHYVHAPATERVFGRTLLDRLIVFFMNFEEGPAILSRFPIVASEVYDLPRCVRALDPRVLLRAEVATSAGHLQIFSTHTTRDDCQTRRVAEIVRERHGALPSLVMGDFNTAETSPAIAALTRDDGLIDAFRRVNPTAPGFTVWQRVEAPGPTVFRRVDYVFMLEGQTVPGAVHASRIVLNAPRRLADGTTLWPSDHYGVLAEVEVTRTGGGR